VSGHTGSPPLTRPQLRLCDSHHYWTPLTRLTFRAFRCHDFSRVLNHLDFTAGRLPHDRKWRCWHNDEVGGGGVNGRKQVPALGVTRVYHLKRNPTKITLCGTKIKPEAGPPRVIDSPNLPRDMWVKVTLQQPSNQGNFYFSSFRTSFDRNATFFTATQFLTIVPFFQWDLVLGGRVANDVQHAHVVPKGCQLRTSKMWVCLFLSTETASTFVESSG
jgi:hypothetical protein